jgi:hypothetical protein
MNPKTPRLPLASFRVIATDQQMLAILLRLPLASFRAVASDRQMLTILPGLPLASFRLHDPASPRESLSLPILPLASFRSDRSLCRSLLILPRPPLASFRAGVSPVRSSLSALPKLPLASFRSVGACGDQRPRDSRDRNRGRLVRGAPRPHDRPSPSLNTIRHDPPAGLRFFDRPLFLTEIIAILMERPDQEATLTGRQTVRSGDAMRIVTRLFLAFCRDSSIVGSWTTEGSLGIQGMRSDGPDSTA